MIHICIFLSLSIGNYECIIFITEYENEAQVGENFVDCSLGKFDENKVCRFNVDQLGDKCLRQRDFGFDEGKPCILLKLNKVIGLL